MNTTAAAKVTARRIARAEFLEVEEAKHTICAGGCTCGWTGDNFRRHVAASVQRAAVAFAKR